MEGSLGLLTSDTSGGVGGGGGSSSSNNNMEKTEPTISKVGMGSSSEGELELGLGLSIGCSGNNGKGKSKVGVGGGWGERGRILTAQDFPCVISGTKRAAEEAGGSPTCASQVVGWPPIRAYRMNSLVNLAKAPRADDEKSVNEKEKSKDALENNIEIGSKISVAPSAREKGHLGFVKVNMDGHPIGRKVDLSAHTCYETLAQALEDMFLKSARSVNSINKVNQPSKLLDGSSEFVLTYEDKDGDWMLVGDVPWGMFLGAVRRLRIMRTSEANGLAPRYQDRNDRQRRKPI